MRNPPDIIGLVRFTGTDEGGRRSACKTGYRGALNFGDPGILHDVVHEFDREWVAPGEVVTSRMRLLAPEYQTGCLSEGLEFTVHEGTRVVGRGRILEVCNHEPPNKPLQPTRAAKPIGKREAFALRPARLSAGVRLVVWRELSCASDL